MLIIPSISAQELNQAFLESLPSEIKQDVLNQILNESSPVNINSKDNKNYSSFDSKLDASFKYLDEDLEDDFSNLLLFGQDFFRSFPSTFMPINDPAASGSYILDVDDIIFIQMIGANSSSLELRLDREGAIFIPNVGKIVLAGLTLDNAGKLINSKIEDSLIEVDAIVSLKQVRDIQVLVTGLVNFPGIYTLGGYSTVLHAISSAGGINDGGSFREIIVKRNGSEIQKIDLYDLLIHGDTSKIKSLRSGDSIIIQSTNSYVRVVGAINRPAIYEFLEGEEPKDLISYAGGFSNNSDNSNYFLSRKSNISLDLLSSADVEGLKLQSNDKIFVPFISYKESDLYLNEKENFITTPVKISGAIKNPGEYYIKQNETLSMLLQRAGGYKKDAYQYGGVLINSEAKILEKSFNDKLYNEAIKSLASLSNVTNNINISSLTGVLAEFKQTKTTGRVVAEFNQEKIFEDSNLDTKLSPGDEIYIPFINDRVYIFGEVLNPGTFKFSENRDLKDYIDLAGGLNKFADKASIIIVYPNGESSRVALRKFAKNKEYIPSGTVIYISRDLTYMEGTDLARTLAPIFSSLAISLASLNSISNN